MRLLVLYGSQTGTAQDVAELIWRESKKFEFTGPVLPMDDYDIERLVVERLVVFVVATTGDGEEPDNMKQTWKFLLRRSLSKNSLSQLNYACLGLGDSSYEKFNYAAKKLNRRLKALGATSVYPMGLCDDQHDFGLGAVALDWIRNFWPTICGDGAAIPLPSVLDGKHDFIYKWHVEVLEKSDKLASVEHLSWPLREQHHQFELMENKRTTADDHFQDVRLLHFKYPNEISWQPGNILQVRPCNSDKQVAAFFELIEEHKLGFNADTIVQLSSIFPDMPLPKAYEEPITLGMAAKYIWDLSVKPRQRFFELLGEHTEDELESDKLLEFGSMEGLADLIAYVNTPRRTILEVLQDFKHATSALTLPLIFELMPIIQPRSFSIASCVGNTKSTLDLLVAVVNYQTKLSTPRLGLCSNWLKDLQPGAVVLGAIKKGTMILPVKLHRPLIMIGPGTGIAPFRSIIQHRLLDSAATGKLVVFFGCRNEKKDFHFVNDFKEWQHQNVVQAFFAFSRDQDDKIYVQQRIREAKELLNELIKEQKACIYVAGSSVNMPKSVKEAFIDVLDCDETYIENLIKTRRYQEETWS